VGRKILLRLTSEEKIEQAGRAFEHWGAWAIGVAGFAPIPFYKEFAIAGGLFNVSPVGFTIASFAGRGARYFIYAALLKTYGHPIVAFVERNFILLTIATIVTVGLAYGAWRFVRRYKEALEPWHGRVAASINSFLDRRHRVWGEFFVYFLTGWVAFSMAVVAFGKVVDEVFLEGAPVGGDVVILKAIHRLASPALTKVMVAVTGLASLEFVTVVFILILGWLIARRRLVDALTLTVLTAGSGAWIGLLKLVFHRPRPTILPHLVLETDFGFPSGHAMISVAFYGMIAYLLLRRSRRRLPVLAAYAVLVGLIGFSRLYLGVHWPTDVLGGYILGGAWLLACILLSEELRARTTSAPGLNRT
jgi:undecaprenyl-diphosphatase